MTEEETPTIVPQTAMGEKPVSDESEEEDTMEARRKRKKEYDKYVEEINLKSNICLHLQDNLKYEEKKLDALKKEATFREKMLKDLKNQYEAIKGHGEDTKETIDTIKAHIIKKKLEELISEKIPELGLRQDKNPEEAIRDGDFKNLVHDKIEVIYTKYDMGLEEDISKAKKFEARRDFKISKKTTFATLKKTACSFWELIKDEDEEDINNQQKDDIKSYLLTTDEEAIIYNEDMLIDEYMKNFSVRSNVVRVINANSIKNRNKLLPIQEDRCKEINKVNLRNKSEVKVNYGGGNQLINEFQRTYSYLDPYFCKGSSMVMMEGEIKPAAKNMETSFFMLILNLLIFILTLLFLVRKDFNSVYNYRKIQAVKNYFSSFQTGIQMTREEGFDNFMNQLNTLNVLYLDEAVGFDWTGTVLVMSELVKDKKCKLDLEGIKCYERKYSKKNIIKEDVFKQLKEDVMDSSPCELINLATYKKKKRIGKYNIKTDSGNFDGSGIAYEINNTLIGSIDNCMYDENLMDLIMPPQMTRGLTIEFNLFFRDDDVFANVLMVKYFYLFLAL
ncbi:MAG: hypothetical protein MJ252_09330 [archaeon]|nr:hypothetical protein [archaeon]